MASRLELHKELCMLLESEHVYFQPSESIKLIYPCIVYYRSGIDKQNANDRMYKSTNEYELITIDRDPDSDLADRILAYFQMCSFSRSYVSDNLNHKVLTLYY